MVGLRSVTTAALLVVAACGKGKQDGAPAADDPLALATPAQCKELIDHEFAIFVSEHDGMKPATEAEKQPKREACQRSTFHKEYVCEMAAKTWDQITVCITGHSPP
jgi:hypothetical protein